MENASQALLIAGTILIALIVLSIGVYLASNSSKVGESYEQTQEIAELTRFNSKFIVYAEREDITAQEVVSISNFVRNYNNENDPDINFFPVIADGVEFIKQNSTNQDGSVKYFVCREENIRYTNGKVSSITFE
ncbi:MAG: hypothetical protein IJB90_01860 [Clostridia bacterium]|nr:hypothetical protein [Clostridia bacterium]